MKHCLLDAIQVLHKKYLSGCAKRKRSKNIETESRKLPNISDFVVNKVDIVPPAECLDHPLRVFALFCT